MAVYAQNRRAKKRANGGTYTREDVKKLHKKQKNKCAACKRERKLQVDHIIAVIRGGSNDPSNIQLLCGTCNKSKGARNFEDWLQGRVDFK